MLASLTKGGLNAATKSLAIEYAKRGIRVNAVVAWHHQDADARARNARRARRAAPVARMGEISDIVEAVIYLESPAS